jgi:hypothetical protein
MFRYPELDRLQRQKELLVLQCETSRSLLALECRQLKSPGWWLGELGRAAQQHPMLTVVLGVGAGALATRLVARPRGLGGLVSLATKAVPVALNMWKLWNRDR